MESNIRYNIKVNNPAESIPVIRIPKFPFINSIRVISRVRVICYYHASGNEDSRYPYYSRDRGESPQIPKLVTVPKGGRGSEKVSQGRIHEY